MQKLSIIIPEFNEGKTIHRILSKVKAVQLPSGIDKEVIIVNDFSIDNTEEAIFQYQQTNIGISVQYFRHPSNKDEEMHCTRELIKHPVIILLFRMLIWNTIHRNIVCCSNPYETVVLM